MPPHLLVLPSPFLGPVPYEPLVAALSSAGYDASVAPSPGTPVAADLVAAWSRLASGLAAGPGDVVLVPHSNAGYLSPAVASAAGAATVFVDAALPASGGTVRLAPSHLRAQLAELARPDGRLPRWTRWWPRADAEATLPGPWFDRVDAVVPEVPLAYVDAEVAVPPGWAERPCAYLALGTTYAEELAVAAAHDWPHARLDDAGHLQLLLEPDRTAAAVTDLLTALET